MLCLIFHIIYDLIFFCLLFTLEAPLIVEKFYSQTLHPGSSLSLKCSSTGYPVAHIRWLFYGKLINHVNYHNNKHTSSYNDANGNTISFLNFTSIDADDGGMYTCKAINDVAESQHSANIHVFGSPIVHSMENLTIASSSYHDIHCPFSGYPIERITWSRSK